MTYRELLYEATRLSNDNKITLLEYEEMTKPLDRVIEQETILDKVRAEIEEMKLGVDLDIGNEKIYNNAITDVLRIIDKYKSESEGKEC